MSCIPQEPDVPPPQRAQGKLTLRYEDVTQDGRVALTALPFSLGVVWREIGQRAFARELQDAGIVPLLSRLCIAGGPGTVSVMEPLEARGSLQLAHAVGPTGEVDRILLLMWTTVTGRRGRTHGPPPDDAGETVEVGRVFAEHVFTRPFAPPDRRKVLRLGAAGLPDVPPARWQWHPPSTLLELPSGATALDAAPTPDDTAVVFGLDHTDSNQHVNSLVYPRLLVEATLRRLAAHGERRLLLARQVELAYRKPSFAGDTVRFAVRAFANADGPGAVAVLSPEGEAGARPLVTARVQLGR
jgi:hypothetical protein